MAKFGARTKNRTWNLDIKSVLLCQLSYAGVIRGVIISKYPSKINRLKEKMVRTERVELSCFRIRS